MQNLSSIDFLLTNNVYAFQKTFAICNGFSDCHKPVLTVLNTTVPRSQPKKLLTENTTNLTLENLRIIWKMFLQKKVLIVVLSFVNFFWENYLRKVKKIIES